MQRRAVFVTNIPAPYREKVHEEVSRGLGGAYHVLYARDRVPDRLWDVEPGVYARSFLKGWVISYRGRFIHLNPEVWRELDRLDPEVVITSGFNPTFLIAFLWAMRHGRPHIPASDGWAGSEAVLSFAHVLVRRLVYRNSIAFIGASRRTLDLYRQYGCPEDALFQSHLCADNAAYRGFAAVAKRFDISFCGQIIDGKMPLFFADVARLLKRQKPDLRVLVVGDGPLRERLLAALREDGIDFHFAGFASQRELPSWYGQTRVFLFPTRRDAWGVVANEACAAGVPVVTCGNAGVAGELVVHGASGFVLELEAKTWAEHVWKLLSDPQLRESFSLCALQRVQNYTYAAAARGIVQAVAYASDRQVGAQRQALRNRSTSS